MPIPSTLPTPPQPQQGLLRSPFRRKNLRPRVLIPVTAALLAIAAARPSPAFLAAGLALAAAGEALRLWATGYLVKTDCLTVAGPYAYLRHPLYAGSLLIGLGLLAAAGPAVLAIGAPLGLGFFFLYYLPYKERRERARLLDRHGSAFEAYLKSVPQLLPYRGRFAYAAQDVRWSFSRVRDNDELGTTLAVTLGFAALALHLALRLV